MGKCVEFICSPSATGISSRYFRYLLQVNNMHCRLIGITKLSIVWEWLVVCVCVSDCVLWWVHTLSRVSLRIESRFLMINSIENGWINGCLYISPPFQKQLPTSNSLCVEWWCRIRRNFVGTLFTKLCSPCPPMKSLNCYVCGYVLYWGHFNYTSSAVVNPALLDYFASVQFAKFAVIHSLYKSSSSSLLVSVSG